MSDAQKAELALALVISVASGLTVLWGLWHACWGIYDHFMQQYKRRKNGRFDARVGRDCYRDIKGIHR